MSSLPSDRITERVITSPKISRRILLGALVCSAKVTNQSEALACDALKIVPDQPRINDGPAVNLHEWCPDNLSPMLGSGQYVRIADLVNGSTNSYEINKPVSIEQVRLLLRLDALQPNDTLDWAILQAAVNQTTITRLCVDKGHFKLSRPLLLRSHLWLDLNNEAVIDRAWNGDMGDGIEPYRGKPGGAIITTSLDRTILPNERIDSSSNITSFGYRVSEDIRVSGGRLVNSSSLNGPGICLVRVRRVALENCKIENCRSDWSLTLAGTDIHISSCNINTHKSLFSDGIHSESGARHLIEDCVVESGDDAYAIGNHYDQALSDILVRRCKGSSTYGCLAKVERTPSKLLPGDYRPINVISRVMFEELAGSGGELRNGAVAIYGGTDSAGEMLLQTICFKDCKLAFTQSDQHDNVNAYGLLIRYAKDVKFENSILFIDVRSSNSIACSSNIDLEGLNISHDVMRRRSPISSE